MTKRPVKTEHVEATLARTTAWLETGVIGQRLSMTRGAVAVVLKELHRQGKVEKRESPSHERPNQLEWRLINVKSDD